MKRILALALALVAAALFAPDAHAAGPWRATIVDAETGQPLEGVVVVAAFTKYTKHLAGTAGGEYYGSDEVVTGPDGRFEIPARNLWNPIRVFTEVRVEFTIAKPGYGRAKTRPTPEQREEWGWGQGLSWTAILEKESVILEMPPLKTREARHAYYRAPGRTVDLRVPRALIPKFVEAENQERAYLGLSP